MTLTLNIEPDSPPANGKAAGPELAQQNALIWLYPISTESCQIADIHQSCIKRARANMSVTVDFLQPFLQARTALELHLERRPAFMAEPDRGESGRGRCTNGRSQ